MLASLRHRLTPYAHLARVDKPVGSYLLFLPSSWSILMATYASPSLTLSDAIPTLALFATGSFVMRGAGCTINDLWDWKLDRLVERTKSRPLASGALSTKQALGLLGLQLSAGLGILLQLNPYSVALGASSLSLVTLYPLAKRITHWPQLILGLTFNWGALLGYSAISSSLSPSAVALYLAGVSWTLHYDTIYALQDKHDDMKIGIRSTAILFGENVKRFLSVFSMVTVVGLTTAGVMNGHGGVYFSSVAVAGIHLGRQIWQLDGEDRKGCWDTFEANVKTGGVVSAGLVLECLMK